jgi:GrpB-like predicted nucleotidyltransferase (UPF0157 family)
MKVIMIPHDPTWMQKFQQEKNAIKKFLGNEAIAIEHIGSTAIPHILAKPVIDILISARNIEKIDTFNEKMAELSYTAHGEYGIPGRRFFTKGPYEKRTHHIHIFQQGDPQLARHLNFRDYMIAHPEEAKAYSDLKAKLAVQFTDDIAGYCRGKNDFIKAIDEKAMLWRQDLNL